MNNDMPWVNLTQEEVDDLRKKKYELTEYGKDYLKRVRTVQEQAQGKTKTDLDAL